ncbi:MAG: ABC transporter substrate-binding protein [Christensenellales bacterium]|jgi:ABC-type glycerol-3-phosphate transport system substrate-binding protein|nr:sugar ABC transporter substrate-binding protein [Christensenellaceae bacterium]
MRLIQKVMLLLLCLAMTISLSCQTVLAEKQLDIKGEIVVWYAGASESRVELYQWAKEKIEAEYPGTTVTLEVIPMAELASRQMTACQSNMGPDVMSQPIAATNGFMKLGLLEPVNELMQRLDRNLLEEFNPDFFELMREGDTLYGVPQSRTALALVYNKAMFEEAGLTEPPKNWNEVQEYAKQLTKKDNEGNTVVYGLGLPGTSGSHIWYRIIPEIWGAGGDICNSEMTQATLDSEATKKALEYYKSFYENGTAPRSMVENDQTATSQMFASGAVAMTIENVTWIRNNVVRENLFDVGVALYPGMNGTNVAGLGGWNACIPSSAKNKEGAAVFIDLITSKEGMEQQLLMPALTEVLEAGDWTDDFYGPYSKMLAEYSRDFPAFENAAAAQTVIMNMVQSILTDSADISSAIASANVEIQELLDQQNVE